MLHGKVTEAEFAYQRTTYIKPTVYNYNTDEEQPYIKYGCPVCESLGNKHQVTVGASNCSMCNVNLLWKSE